MNNHYLPFVLWIPFLNIEDKREKELKERGSRINYKVTSNICIVKRIVLYIISGFSNVWTEFYKIRK